MNADSVENNGVLAWTVRNEDAGGVPLVFLHGAGGEKEIWSAVARRFAALRPDRPLALVDLPGHGDAPPPGRDRIEDYAAEVRAFLDERAWPQFDLAGHSMGGAISQALAADMPDRVRRVALISTGATLDVNPMLIDLLPNQMDLVMEMFESFAFGPDTPRGLIDVCLEPLRLVDPVVFRNDFIACRNWNAGERLDAIQAPCLVAVGEKDWLTPAKRGKFLAANLKNAKLEIFMNAGHMLPVERHRELGDLLAAFLED
jgi:pimeloyl-ACP methyl ester carboxylesterase